MHWKLVWSAHLVSALGVVSWAVQLQPKTGDSPVWIVPISILLLIGAFAVGSPIPASLEKDTTKVLACVGWSIALAALSLAAAGRWFGLPLWYLAIVALGTLLLLAIRRPKMNQSSL